MRRHEQKAKATLTSSFAQHINAKYDTYRLKDIPSSDLIK